MAAYYNASNAALREARRLRWPLMLLFSWIPFASLAEGLLPPQQVIKTTSEQMLRILERDRQKLVDDPEHVYRLAKEILVPHVDMYRVSRLVLGRHWRRASKEQRRRFSTEFRRMLVRTYASALKQFRADADIRFLPMHMKPGADDVIVNTTIAHVGAKPVSVSYRMHLKNGRWLSYDVKIEGVSLVTNYRSSFSSQIRQKGLDTLIQRISELNQRRTQTKEQIIAETETR